MYDVIIIGAGASGLMAAAVAASKGARVALLEHKDDIGKKILATGNGRRSLWRYARTSHTRSIAQLCPDRIPEPQ